LMGGDVQVASSVGEGSTFTFLMRPSMIDHAPAHDYDLLGRSVLVVSKRSGVVSALGSIITGSGGVLRHVEAAEMAAESLAALVSAGRPPVGVLLDVGWGERSYDWFAEEIRQAAAGAPVRIIALAAPGDSLTGHRLERAGFDSWIPRPVPERRLLGELTGRMEEKGLSLSTAQGRIPMARVLVAEDDPACMAVAVMMLDKLGCDTTVVSTGSEAVEAATRAEFDLILMDCLMPEMDGYAAARAIREANGPATPIVALTASASAKDRRRALDAGMDAHMTKPFELATLRGLLANWVGPEDVPIRSVSSTNAHDGPANTRDVDIPTFDLTSAVHRVGGDQSVIRQILDIFVHSWTELDQRMEDGLDTSDARELHMAAHRIKSTAGTLGAHRLATAATEAERAWLANRMDGASDRVATLRSEFEAFLTAAASFRGAAH